MATRRERLLALVMRGGAPRRKNTMANFNLPGYTVQINEDGLSKLMLNETVLGDGIVQLLDGSWFYRPWDPAKYTPTVSSKLVTYQPNGATVTHTYTGLLSATVVYTYVVSGNDIHISAHATNNHATKSLQPAFKSMPFFTGSGGYKIGLGYDQNHTQASGEILSYPSTNVPYSASVLSAPSVAGPNINLAVWSEESPLEKFMTLPSGFLISIFFNHVPPGGSRIFKWAFRFQNSTDWKDLLGGYKAHLRAAFPTLAYEPDARPLVNFSSVDPSFIRPDNPYGYNDNGGGVFRRFDTLAGCQDYVSKLAAPMADTNYQGIVMWQPQGIHPRGVQYRSDFNVFPSVTIPNLPTLTSGFNGAGLTIGLLSRPKSVITSNTWTTDGLIRISDFPESMLDLTNRIQWAIANGFKGFYLDSFIADGPDHGILKAIRTAVGPNAHTFCEFSTALSMAYSASYEEITWSGSAIVLTQKQQILRWLYPESIVAAQFRGPLPSGGYATLYPAMFALKLTPWVEDYRAIPTAAGSENAIIKPLVASFIGPNKRWL